MSTMTISRAPSTTARPASSAAPVVRLTRRGQVVAVLLLAMVIFCAFTVYGSRSAATDESGGAVETRTVEVGPGDTLWGIAAEVAGPGEVRETVLRIEKLNSLPGPGLVVGQEIAVPLG